jgi:Lipocalin-like domain
VKRLLLSLVFTLSVSWAAAGDREALVGVWRYAGELDTKVDGSPAPTPAISDTQGLLIYTADGFMSIVHMHTNRTWLAETASIAELRETVANGNAYAGRYEVDPATHTVTHITSVSMEPAFQGKRLTRNYILQGNTLQL